MNEDDVVRIVRLYIEGLFPKVCSNCGRRFGSLREYLETTTHLESPVLYDKITEHVPSDPLGPMSLANCTCGTTLAVSSRGIPPAQLVELLTWARSESLRRSIDVRELLHHIRDRIDGEVLRSNSFLRRPGPGGAPTRSPGVRRFRIRRADARRRTRARRRRALRAAAAVAETSGRV